MAEEDTGANNQDPGNQPGQQEPGGQDAAGQDQKSVPLEVLQSVRQEKQEESRRRQDAEDRLRYLEQQGNQQAQGGQNQPQDPLGDLDDDEVLTVGQAKKLREQGQQQSQAVMEEMRLRTNPQTSDYDEVIQQYLPELLKEDPGLQQDLANAPNPYRLAYRLGKEYKNRAPAGQQQPRTQQAETPTSSEQSELDRTLDQQGSTPGSVSQAGSSTQAPASGAERYADQGRRSPQELDEEIAAAKRQARAGG